MQSKTANKITISLDIGHSSIGWSVIDPKNLKIKGCGSLLFQADDCLASKRRLFRSGRRNIAATRNRIARIAALLKHIGAFKGNEAELVCNSSPWIDASRVLLGIETLDWPRLWNVIRWYAHNRGYDGNKAWSKSMPEEEAVEEAKRVKAASGIMQEYSTSTMAQTVCAMLNLDPKGKKRSTTGKKYKTGDYAFDRTIVENEVREILRCHLGKLQGLDEKLIIALLDDARVIECPEYKLPLRFVRGLLFGGFVPRFDNRLISICPITGEKTPSKKRKEFYEYRWAMILVGIRIFGEMGESWILSPSERKALDDEIRKIGFFTKKTLKDFIKDNLGHEETNIDTYFLTPEMEKALVFDPAKKAINTACLNEAFKALPLKAQKSINSRLNKSRRTAPSKWLEHFDNIEEVKGLMEVAFDKVIKRKKGKNKPTFEKWLNQDLDVEKNIPSGRAPYSKRILLEATKEVMEGKDPREAQGCLDAVALLSKAKLSIPVEKQTNNHLVRHRLIITERLYREIIKEFTGGDLSMVDSVVVETARDLREFSGKSNKEKQKILGGKLKQHRDAVKTLEDFRTETGKSFRISAGLIRKTRIALDMEFKCPFSGDTYDLYQILDGSIDVEHIIPRSLRPSDSLDGLVLTFKEVNRWKAKRTALQFIVEEGGNQVPGLPQKSIMQVKKFEAFVKKLKENGSSNDDIRRKKNRKRFLTLKNFNERESDFTAGDLTVTSQINRLATFRIRSIHQDKVKQPKYVALPGSATGLARKSWRLLGCLAQANSRVLNEDGSLKTKSEVRGITHLHHALDASVAAITATILPNDGDIWRMLNKRRLTDLEARQLGQLDVISISANKEPRLKDLPKDIKENLAQCLSEKRVKFHIPARIGSFSPDENEYGVESVDHENQVADLRRGGNLYKGIKLSLLTGIDPSGSSKLKERDAVLLNKRNYGLWLGDPPEVIPNLRSWEKIKELRTRSSESKIARLGDFIEVKKGTYKGTWRIISIKNTANGLQLDLSPPDSIPSRDFKLFGGKIAGLNTIIRDGVKIVPRCII
jgi:CRISPR-associated endonuclease Csn1